MANFCGKCGSKLNRRNGLCPKCDAKELGREKVRFGVAGLLIILAAAILVVTFLINNQKDNDMKGDSVNIIEKNTDTDIKAESGTEHKLIRIERLQDNGRVDQVCELSYNDAGQISNVMRWTYADDGQQVFENAYPIEYDKDGRMIRNGILGLGAYSEYEYNEDGQLIRSVAAEGGSISTSYEYNDDGKLQKTTTQAEGADTVVVYQYDKDGRIQYRIETTQYYDGEIEEISYHYTYDQNGQLIEMNSDSSTTYYSYDQTKRISEIISEDDTYHIEKHYSYDCKPLVICEETWTLLDGNSTYSYGRVEIQDVMNHVILSQYFGQGKMEADTAGNLVQIRNEEDEFTLKFYYSDITSHATGQASPMERNSIEESLSTVTIDMDCDHIFEIFPGKNGIETSCRFCGISMDDLINAGIVLPDVDCEHNYEKVIQTNGTPAYECKNCHNILLYNCPPLTELKLLSDTNAKGRNDDIKYGTFYHNGREWLNAVRFWVADKSGYTNTEYMEVYLANAYTELYIVTFAAKESDDHANMTLRFYGDGELLYEVTDITKDAKEIDTRIDISDVEVLKVECSTEKDAFGYCILQGIVS